MRSILATVLALLLLGASAGYAQELRQQALSNDLSIQQQRTLIETTLQAVVTVLQEATLQHPEHAVGTRLRQMVAELRGATERPATPVDPTPAPPLQPEELERLLEELHAQLSTLRAELEADQEVALANRLAPIERGLYEALEMLRTTSPEVEREARDVARAETRRPPATRDGWLAPGRYTDDGYEPLDRERDRRRDRERDRKRDRHRDRDDDEDRFERWRERARISRPTFVANEMGEYGAPWPFRETALYRPVPAIRYNRVEGLVLGVGVPPLEWDDYDRVSPYGQVARAFALDRWRYTAGAEVRPTRGGYRDFGFKLGGNYHYNTATDDLWKSGWVENSLAAFLFKNDFFDYFQTRGWTLYGVAQLTPYALVSAGYRVDEYESLEKSTDWALFGGDGFRFNPAVDEGEMRSFVVSLDAGRVEGFDERPRGAALRAEVELGDGLGGVFSFNRYLADGRAYVPVTGFSTLGVRVRGGLMEGDFVPVQKHFTIGGIGSVRGYPQNAFFGTHLLLANVEYAVEGLSFFDETIEDVLLLGFVDAGWAGDSFTLDRDAVIPSAGLGVGFGDRRLRLELAWPLRDLGTGLSPSLWLRLNPSF